jgi:hypothetical protein
MIYHYFNSTAIFIFGFLSKNQKIPPWHHQARQHNLLEPPLWFQAGIKHGLWMAKHILNACLSW